MDSVVTLIKVELNMKVIGKMICNKDSVNKFGQMDHNIKGIFIKERDREEELMKQRMVQNTKGNGKMEK